MTIGHRVARYLRNNALGALALFVALGGVSYAATGGFASGGQLRACVNGRGALTLLKSGKHCKRGQRLIAWNQRGPAGAQGQPGAVGPAGPAGINGLNGQPSNVMWAKIGEEGTIEAGHGVTRVEDDGKSPYTVTFEKDVTNCAVVASQNGENVVFFVSGVTTEPALGHRAEVHIGSTTGERKAVSFSIIAVC